MINNLTGVVHVIIATVIIYWMPRGRAAKRDGLPHRRCTLLLPQHINIFKPRFHAASTGTLGAWPTFLDVVQLDSFIWWWRDHFVYAPSQCGTTLYCNAVSHWLGAHKNDPWWCHDFYALLTLCEGNSPVTDGLPSQRTCNTDKGNVLFANYWTNSRSTGDSRHHNAHLASL